MWEDELFWATVALSVVVVGLVEAARQRPFPPSLTPQQLSALAKLSGEGGDRGLEALKSYYGWRQDQLASVARGFGGFAVTLLVALLAATFESDRTADGETSVAAFVLVGASLALAGAAWWRQRELQREFAEDTRRLSWLIP